MLDLEFSSELVEPNAPVNLSLFTDSEAIGVGEDVIDADEGFAKIRFEV